MLTGNIMLHASSKAARYWITALIQLYMFRVHERRSERSHMPPRDTQCIKIEYSAACAMYLMM